jgi:hypothetical protein
METRYVQVEGHPGLIRDLKTNAILNTDTQASSHYTSSKERRLKEKEKQHFYQSLDFKKYFEKLVVF